MAIKVANIIEEGRLGGPQIRIAEVAKMLKPMGVDTTVIYPCFNSTRFEKRLNNYKITTIQLPIHRLTKQKKALVTYIFFFVYEFILLFCLFKKEKFDIVHVSGGSWQFKGVIAGKLAGSKVIWHLNDTNVPIIFRYCFRLLSKWFVDGLIVAGKRVREYYVGRLGMNGKPVYEIQAPVDTRFFNPDAFTKTGKVLNGFGINIVSIGNINPAKGFGSFIRMAYALKDIKDLTFHIVGPHLASQKEYSKTLLKLKQELGIDRLVFYGASDKIRDILKETDIYVCSSENEASPLSVWEAMSMGKAIVSADVGDVSCLIKDGENGFVVPCKSPELLAQKVKILIDDPKLRQKFGEGARRVAVDQVDVFKISQLHKAAYTEVMGVSR